MQQKPNGDFSQRRPMTGSGVARPLFKRRQQEEAKLIHEATRGGKIYPSFFLVIDHFFRKKSNFLAFFHTFLVITFFFFLVIDFFTVTKPRGGKSIFVNSLTC